MFHLDVKMIHETIFIGYETFVVSPFIRTFIYLQQNF